MPTQNRKPTETRTGRNTATTRRKAETDGKPEPTPRRPRTAKTVVPPTPMPAPQPARPASDDRYAVTAWGSEGNGGPQDLEMPSGQVALVRKPGLERLITEGVLHRMDSLTALVDKKYIKKGRGGAANPDNVDVTGLLGNPEAMAGVLHTVDRVVCACVIKPHVEMAPNDPTNRMAGVVYADTIDLTDKMFIFNWVLGGTTDLESFRRESEEVVGSLSVGESLSDEAE
jgi:hypothetical protein